MITESGPPHGGGARPAYMTSRRVSCRRRRRAFVFITAPLFYDICRLDGHPTQPTADKSMYFSAGGDYEARATGARTRAFDRRRRFYAFFISVEKHRALPGSADRCREVPTASERSRAEPNEVSSRD